MPPASRERFLRKHLSIEATNHVPIRYQQTNGAIVREDARSPRTLGRRRKMSDMAALTLEHPLFATYAVAVSLMVLRQ
jgi:hypothetical protein